MSQRLPLSRRDMLRGTTAAAAAAGLAMAGRAIMPARNPAPVTVPFHAGKHHSPTPSPSSSTPPPGFTLGTTQPDASNTGYGVLGYTAASLVDVSPASPYVYSITTDGTVLEGKRIHGIVEILANNVTVRGCEIVGQLNIPYPGSTHYGLVSSGGTGNVIEYNSLTQYDPSTGTDNSAGSAGGVPTYWMVGVLLTGGSATVSRNNIHDVNDTVYMTGGTHQVLGNYLHDPMFRTDDADQSSSSPPSWSHNDGVQIMGGTNHMIDGNSFVWKFSDLTGMPTAANPSPPPTEQVWPNAHGMIIQNNKNALSGITVQRNWFKYGSNAIRFGGAQAFDPGGAITLTGNRFTPDQGQEFSQYVQIRLDPTTSWSPQPAIDSTNVYSDDPDTPLAVRGLPLNGNPVGNPTLTGSTKIWAYNVSAHTP